MANTIYGYVRVSTKDQNEARQMIAMQEFGIDEKHIFLDKQSGKDFNRPKYSSVDVACSSMLVMHLDTERHFSEVKRILKRDGVYVFATTGLKHNQEIKRLGFDPHSLMVTECRLKFTFRHARFFFKRKILAVILDKSPAYLLIILSVHQEIVEAECIGTPVPEST